QKTRRMVVAVSATPLALARATRRSQAARHHRSPAIRNGNVRAHSLAVCLSLLKLCVHVCTDRNVWLVCGYQTVPQGQLQTVELATPQASFAKQVGAQVRVRQVLRTRPGVRAASAFLQEGMLCLAHDLEHGTPDASHRNMPTPLLFGPPPPSTQEQPESADHHVPMRKRNGQPMQSGMRHGQNKSNIYNWRQQVSAL
ncbi:MAG: hypothetical protein SGPRY_004239, partial [Prymnesium sp.]